MQKSYPLWKIIALLLLVVVGVIYVIPNFYPEYPVLQISSDVPVDPQALEKKIAKLLQEERLDYRFIVAKNDGVDIQFSSTDTQLLARDVLKNTLDTHYIIALNLVSSTPHWLRAINALPMKQGLDLRGGVHFLLEVDIDSVIGRRYEGLMKNIGQDLRDAGIRYSGIRAFAHQGIQVAFRNETAFVDAKNHLSGKLSGVVFEDSNHPLTVNIALSATELNTIRQNTIEQTIGILRNRVNELGIGEAVVQQQGATRIAVDLPGIQDAARAKQILGGTATLEFHMVDADHDAALVKQTGAVPLGSKLYTMNGQPILLKRQVVLSGDSITSAVSSFDQQTGTPAVEVQLGGGGEALFTKVTRENIGKRMAIVFVETKTVESPTDKTKHTTHREERVISAPVILNVLGHQFQITGLSDGKEAGNLALLLRAGALPAAIYPIVERTVGPTLGKENIHRGIVSLEVGMGLIFLLMIVYYRLFGVVANVALMLNLVLLCALLSMLGATLTLPGIAGIVLTVGMAVDANVLIYERIREELRNGMSPKMAINAGYERAFATILDANVTTFIVAVVLFSIGTGPVRGFAVTLSLGLLTSMLTGVTYSRAFVDLLYRNKAVKKLSIGI